MPVPYVAEILNLNLNLAPLRKYYQLLILYSQTCMVDISKSYDSIWRKIHFVTLVKLKLKALQIQNKHQSVWKVHSIRLITLLYEGDTTTTQACSQWKFCLGFGVWQKEMV